jgi:hypothetical protein
MARERKSPQEKKLREYGDRVTPGNRRNAEARKKEKRGVGREIRNKTENLLAQVKPELPSQEAENLTEEITAGRVRKSVIRKRVLKYNAAPFSKVVEWQRERRVGSFQRKKRSYPHYDRIAREAVGTLNAIDNNQFAEIARRAGILCSPENCYKYARPQDLKDPIARALEFVRRATTCYSHEHQALCRNDDLKHEFRLWLDKADRILRKDQMAREKKAAEQRAIQQKLKTVRA